MAIAPVLKTGVRKDFWVRIPGPPLQITNDSSHLKPAVFIAGLFLRRAMTSKSSLHLPFPHFELERLLHSLTYHASPDRSG